MARNINNPSLTDEEMEARKIFVGGLSQHTTDDGLRHYFNQFGPVQEIILRKDPYSPNLNRGFGFVIFATKEGIDATLKNQDNHNLDGKRIHVEKSKPLVGVDTNATKIFVTNLAKDTTVESLKEFFSKYGNVTDASVVVDRSSQESRGFGFVAFDSEQSMNNVFNAGLITWNGRTLEIRKAMAKHLQAKMRLARMQGQEWGSAGAGGYGPIRGPRGGAGYGRGYEASPYGYGGYGAGGYGYGGYGAGYGAREGASGGTGAAAGSYRGYGYDSYGSGGGTGHAGGASAYDHYSGYGGSGGYGAYSGYNYGGAAGASGAGYGGSAADYPPAAGGASSGAGADPYAAYGSAYPSYAAPSGSSAASRSGYHPYKR